MPTIAYKIKRMRPPTLVIVAEAIAIIQEYQAAGYELTLRQLYYQFVARGWLPNSQREYKKLGTIISDARLAGLIDWDAIVDRLRHVEGAHHWNTPEAVIAAAAQSYNIDTRATQNTYVEVWVEKDALAGVVERACRPLDVPFFACRGYTSQTALWQASQRLIAAQEARPKGKAVVFHLGDHDPSGLDMTRDIRDRLDTFGYLGRVERLALTFDQIDEYKPPPNPAKVTDSRFETYLREHGADSWELDALDPPVIVAVIQNAIAAVTTKTKQERLRRKETTERKLLTRLSEDWPAHVRLIRNS